jgi:hypothetical protein
MKKLFLFTIMTALSSDVFAFQTTELTELMDKWISIESQKGQLQRNWKSQQQHLKQKSKLLATEIQSLNKVLEEAKNSNDAVDTKRLDVIRKQTDLEQDNEIVKNKLAQVSEYAYTLLPQLPPPLKIQWQEKLLLLKQESASSSEKLERLLTLFKLVNEFNERIAINRTSMKIPGNDKPKNMLVTQIYLGVSQAWYVSDDGLSYGYGRTDKLGWLWWHNEEADTELGHPLTPSDLLLLTDMVNNPTKASFLHLPIKLKTKKDIG